MVIRATGWLTVIVNEGSEFWTPLESVRLIWLAGDPDGTRLPILTGMSEYGVH